MIHTTEFLTSGHKAFLIKDMLMIARVAIICVLLFMVNLVKLLQNLVVLTEDWGILVVFVEVNGADLMGSVFTHGVWLVLFCCSFDQVQLVLVFWLVFAVRLISLLICSKILLLYLVGVLLRLRKHLGQVTDEYLIVHQMIDLLSHLVVFDQVLRVGDFSKQSLHWQRIVAFLGFGKILLGRFDDVCILVGVLLLLWLLKKSKELLGWFLGNSAQKLCSKGLKCLFHVVLL